MRKPILLSMVVLLGVSFSSWGMICKGMSCCEEGARPAQAAINCCQPEDQVGSSSPAVKTDAPSFDILPVVQPQGVAGTDLTVKAALHSGTRIKINSPPLFLLKSTFLI